MDQTHKKVWFPEENFHFGCTNFEWAKLVDTVRVKSYAVLLLAFHLVRICFWTGFNCAV